MSSGGFAGSPLGVVAVVWSLVRTLRGVAEGRSALPGFGVVAVVGALGLVVNLAFVLSGLTRRQLEQSSAQQPGLPPGFAENLVRIFEAAGPILALVTPFLNWLVVSLLMQLTTRFFDGRGPLSSMPGVVGVAQMPTLVGLLITVPPTLVQTLLGPQNTAGVLLGYLAGLLGVAFFLWYVVLVAVGAAQARNIGYGESAGSCAISCIGVGILLLLAGVVLGIGLAATLGAVPPR